MPPGTANIEAYGKKMESKRIKRSLGTKSHEIHGRPWKEGQPTSEGLAEAEESSQPQAGLPGLPVRTKIETKQENPSDTLQFRSSMTSKRFKKWFTVSQFQTNSTALATVNSSSGKADRQLSACYFFWPMEQLTFRVLAWFCPESVPSWPGA